MKIPPAQTVIIVKHRSHCYILLDVEQPLFWHTSLGMAREVGHLCKYLFGRENDHNSQGSLVGCGLTLAGH